MDSTALIEWSELVKGRFIAKVNRFAANVDVGGEVFYVHVPNPTPAAELLVQGAEVLMTRLSPDHRTKFRLIAAKAGNLWATLDTAIPNVVFREGIRRSLFSGFFGRHVLKEGVRLGDSIIDFALSGSRPCFVEVKSCTLVRDSTAMFPDAVTQRGRRHLRALEAAVAAGAEAYMVWIVQRPDANELKPYRERDPGFATEAILAKKAGVRFSAYTCSFDRGSLWLKGEIPVLID